MPLEVVCASDKGPLGLSWDAWVAIGTLALAVVTVAAIVVPIVVDWRRRKRSAARYAALFDHELAVLFAQMVKRFVDTSPPFRDVEKFELANETIRVSHGLIGVPLLELLVERLDVFPTRVAMTLGVVLSTVIQIKKNPPPHELESASINHVHAESMTLAVRTWQARSALRKVAGHFTQLPELTPIPQNVLDEWNFVCDPTGELRAQGRRKS